jgi:hypothetical protein
MSDLKSAAKLALEALTATMSTHGFREHIEEAQDKAIKALEEALAKQEQDEPVAWMHPDWPDGYSGFQSPVTTYMTNGWIPLYTTPQQRKPLTHEQRLDLHTAFEPHKSKWNAQSILIDMVEASHGITASEAEDSAMSKT